MNRKNWLSGLLTVSLAVIPTCTITAEENSKIVDQYIIVELEPVSVSDSDTAESMSETCLLYTSPSPRDLSTSRMPSSA